MTKLTKDFMRDIIAGKGFGVAPAAVEEMASALLEGMAQEQQSKAAVATLEHHGFTWQGGEQWKPPLGLPPAFVSNDRAELQEYRKSAGKPIAWLNEDELPENYPYDEMFPFSKVDIVRLFPVYSPQPAPAVEVVPVVMKDHQIRELVNELRDIAVEYHGTHQLRERIARTLRTAMLQSFGNSEQLNSPVIPDGWVMVPVEPTEDMVIAGFESEPDETFSKPEVWEEYQAMSGCQQAAYRAKLCWSAMLAAAPQQEGKCG
jgi:hypothetical protein